MKKLLLYLSLSLIIYFVTLKTVPYWPESKVKHVVYVLLNSKSFVKAIRATEQEGYVSIQWVQTAPENEVSLAWVSAGAKYQEVSNPDLSRIVVPYKESGFSSLWLQKEGEAWILRKAFTFKSEYGVGEGAYALGKNIDPKDVCLPKVQCLENLFDNWYVIKN
ncbi:hypothetical protein A7985_07465 [Pseudoalteromonas luteoviolacea]|uniref:Uncharacterized protein n=1 Tax=Pseudoalteromonas luteoviolacea TaxID=43657 RepID=A0A1C0TWT3_9GAMM|nr:hypothetical protein [Pseudoalteromonas luteoviolacea]OCQ23769.1 hypothetical protein A7985_07465 [Pseudoalteromonas luteoviolacea]